MKRGMLVLTGLAALGAWALSSCSPADFQSATVIDTVRILASRASEPRAKPGDTVTVDLLAFDGRVNPPEKMNLYWLPIACINPPNDAYYACFAQLGAPGADGGVLVPTTDAGAGADSGADSGAGAGLAALLQPGVDLTPLLASGPTFRFRVPDDIIIPRKGVSPSYGLVILFNFACAGHIELLAPDPGNPSPQQIPIGCFDSHHTQLGPDDFVFGFTRVYAYETSDEANPVISQVSIGSSLLDIDGGTTTAPFPVSLCTSGDAGSCPKHSIGPVVGPSLPKSKEVWADFFATAGTFSSSARLLYDTMATLSIPSGTNNNYFAPSDLTGAPAQNFIWIVVHDDQGGADWVTVPLQIN